MSTEFWLCISLSVCHKQAVCCAVGNFSPAPACVPAGRLARACREPDQGHNLAWSEHIREGICHCRQAHTLQHHCSHPSLATWAACCSSGRCCLHGHSGLLSLLYCPSCSLSQAPVGVITHSHAGLIALLRITVARHRHLQGSSFIPLGFSLQLTILTADLVTTVAWHL